MSVLGTATTEAPDPLASHTQKYLPLHCTSRVLVKNDNYSRSLLSQVKSWARWRWRCRCRCCRPRCSGWSGWLHYCSPGQGRGTVHHSSSWLISGDRDPACHQHPYHTPPPSTHRPTYPGGWFHLTTLQRIARQSFTINCIDFRPFMYNVRQFPNNVSHGLPPRINTSKYLQHRQRRNWNVKICYNLIFTAMPKEILSAHCRLLFADFSAWFQNSAWFPILAHESQLRSIRLQTETNKSI